MKQIKKIKYIHIITGLMLFGIILSISASAVVAWSNGTHPVGWKLGERNSNPVENYYKDYRELMYDKKREYYGTHDWIAESALELLYALRPLNVFLNKLRGDPITNDMLKMYFLYGTEVPDQDSLSSQFRTNCDYLFKRSDFGTRDHTALYFNGDGSPRLDTLARVASDLYHQIELAFEAKDCQRAAAFIGALIHIIGDATMYNHVIDGIGRQKVYETHVGHVTYRKWLEGTRELWPGILEFFSVFEAQGMLTALTHMQPYFAVVRAGQDTYFGVYGTFDAVSMFNYRPTSTNHGFWDSVNGPVGNQYDLEHVWTYQMRPTGSSDIAKYFNTIEHNLNMAIYYSAAALNYILDKAGYTDCSCLGDWPAQDNDQGQGRRDRADLRILVDEFSGLLFFNMAGLFATGLAVAILSKLNILEKLIPA